MRRKRRAFDDEDPEPVFKYDDELDMARVEAGVAAVRHRGVPGDKRAQVFAHHAVGNFGRARKRRRWSPLMRSTAWRGCSWIRWAKSLRTKPRTGDVKVGPALRQWRPAYGAQRLITGQVKVIEGQARMAERQDRLSSLEEKILGVLEKPPS